MDGRKAKPGALPALGRHLNIKPEEVSATAVGGSPKSDKEFRLNTIRDMSIAGKEAMARRKARARVLPARSSTTGFTIGHALATELLPEPAEGSGNTEGSSATGHQQEDVMLNNMRDELEEAGDRSEALHRQTVLGAPGGSVGFHAEAGQTSNSSPNLMASPERTPMEFSRLNGEELALLNHTHRSALAGMNHMEAPSMLRHAQESSGQPLQLQPAATPPPHAALSPAAAACSFDRPDVEMLAHTPAQPPVNELDRLLNGGSPDTERCGRRKSKGSLPRTKKTHARQSKQVVPDLREPLLPRPSSAYTPDPAEASHENTPSSPPLEDLDSQPCDGMWRKLGSSLSAVWRWLCKSGYALKKLCRKVRKKLMTAMGLDHDEAQAHLAEQQSEERQALAAGPVVPLQHVEQPQSPSRLQRWRL